VCSHVVSGEEVLDDDELDEAVVVGDPARCYAEIAGASTTICCRWGMTSEAQVECVCCMHACIRPSAGRNVSVVLWDRRAVLHVGGCPMLQYYILPCPLILEFQAFKVEK
jgi:hypothetical protein